MSENGGKGEEQLVEPDDALPEITMSELPQALQAAAGRAGWTALMPVQARAIPYLLAGRDLMVQSRTGSGKTGAFVLPLIERLDPARAACQALILVPTRELCRQVSREVEVLCGGSGLRSVAVYGGVAYGPQLEAFRKGAHVVIGTPGRVLDHLLKRSLKLNGLSMLVFDEADRMLSMGFYPDMLAVKRHLPSHHVNGYMFSATFPPKVMSLASDFLSKPEALSLSRDHVHVTDTTHVFYVIPVAEKNDRPLVRIIEAENPTSAIIFCNTKREVHYVTVVLQRFGYDADELSSDLPQNARDGVLKRVREGSLRFLVATDVAARGIDIPDLSHVILYDLPDEKEAYIHRAGRTGRVGTAGEAISLVSGIEQMLLKQIAEAYDIDMVQRELPTDEDVRAIVAERATVLLEARLRARDKLQTERMQRFVPLARSLGESDDELAIIAMLLDDYYQAAQHAPPPPPRPSAAAPAGERRRPRPDSRSRSPRKGRRPRG